MTNYFDFNENVNSLDSIILKAWVTQFIIFLTKHLCKKISVEYFISFVISSAPSLKLDLNTSKSYKAKICLQPRSNFSIPTKILGVCLSLSSFKNLHK